MTYHMHKEFHDTFNDISHLVLHSASGKLSKKMLKSEQGNDVSKAWRKITLHFQVVGKGCLSELSWSGVWSWWNKSGTMLCSALSCKKLEFGVTSFWLYGYTCRQTDEHSHLCKRIDPMSSAHSSTPCLAMLYKGNIHVGQGAFALFSSAFNCWLRGCWRAQGVHWIIEIGYVKGSLIGVILSPC